MMDGKLLTDALDAVDEFMTDKQSEALRLADALESDGKGCTCAAYSSSECGCGAKWADQYAKEAAAELRLQHGTIVELSGFVAKRNKEVSRLHEINAELVGFIAFVLRGVNSGAIKAKPILDFSNESADEIPIISLGNMARAALAKAQGDNND